LVKANGDNDVENPVAIANWDNSIKRPLNIHVLVEDP
jgi:hypothetical protein